MKADHGAKPSLREAPGRCRALRSIGADNAAIRLSCVIIQPIMRFGSLEISIYAPECERYQLLFASLYKSKQN
jgi:hypothetical protein